MPTPTGNENLGAAITLGESICWDETHGYNRYPGTRELNPDTDCSYFVGYCLANSGFNVNPNWYTGSMITDLQNYPGFTEHIYDPTMGFTFQHGDICVYDEDGGAAGHTFFIGENLYGYTGTYWRTATSNRAVLPICKVEAAGTHNHSEQGDQDNGYGAHTEVWVHAYSGSPVYQVDNGQGLHWPVWHIFRWMQAPPPPMMHELIISRFIRKRRNQLP